MTTSDKSPSRAGICALVGPPNAGKSTFLNRALGMRLAAVSPRPQTTRNRILGVVNHSEPPAQIVYLDTPGAQLGETALRRYMRETSLGAAGDCDVAVVLLDAADPRYQRPEDLPPGAASALDEILQAISGPAILALNKIDRLADKQVLLPIIAAYAETGRYAAIVPISAATGSGLDALQSEIARALPEGAWLFPEDMVTDRAERFIAGELIREQLFRQLGEEVPYATAVVVEGFEDRSDRGDVVITAEIFVERESQKAIVVGKGGARIKQVGTAARAAIAELLGCPVHVRLHVKVAPDWSKNPQTMRRLGYD